MKRILLVEDEEMLLRSLGYFLENNQFGVIAFDNGADAIQFIENRIGEFDLVITDLNLPFAAGQQVIQAVRNSENQNLPIIVLTSSSLESTELEVLELGADEFVTKPFSPAVLIKRIDKLLSSKS